MGSKTFKHHLLLDKRELYERKFLIGGKNTLCILFTKFKHLKSVLGRTLLNVPHKKKKKKHGTDLSLCLALSEEYCTSKCILWLAYPAMMVAMLLMCHSGALNPRIHTPWCGSSPSCGMEVNTMSHSHSSH